MKKVTFKYRFEELVTLYKLFMKYTPELREHANNNIRMQACILHAVAIRMAKRALNTHVTYQFSMSEFEAIAYYQLWGNGHITTNNEWTKLILNENFKQIHQALSL